MTIKVSIVKKIDNEDNNFMLFFKIKVFNPFHLSCILLVPLYHYIYSIFFRINATMLAT